MTIRAVVLGLLGACFIAGVTYLNDWVAHLSELVSSHFPTSVFGLLFLVVMVVNPVLRRLRTKWVLRPIELAVITTLMLVACSIPNFGLMLYFPRGVVMPIHFNTLRPGWQKHKLLSYVPASMMPAGGDADSKVVDGFVRGWGQPGRPIGLGDVPWSEWFAPLTTWLPLVLLFAVAVICMSLIVHRQWSKHESLRYPIANFATTLMGEGSEKGSGSIFRNNLFWLGVVTVLVINVVNGLHAWYPGSIEIPMNFNLTALQPKLPGTPRSWTLMHVHIYPVVIAFCFLLSSEVCFSLGVSQIAFVFLAVPFLKAGVDLSGSWWVGGVYRWQRFGSYLGVALLVLYTGRHYYWGVLKQAITFHAQERVERYAAWALRILLLSLAAIVLILWRVGLDLPLALLVVPMIMMMFLVIARINAECGLFHIAPYWTPMAVFLGMFGAAALGMKAFLIIGLLTLVFTVHTIECLIPFVVNGLKMCDTFNVKPGRVGWGAAGAFAISLAVAVPVVLWAIQNYGAQAPEASWSTKVAPTGVFDAAAGAAAKLKRSAQLGKSDALTGWQRITHVDPDRRFLWAAGTGLLLVVVLSVLRLRYAWWPLHPVMFVVWGTHAIGFMAYCFLFGWFLRQVVARFGGARKFREVRILMFGVIAGELLGKLIFVIVGAIYYAKTGRTPPPYGIFPQS